MSRPRILVIEDGREYVETLGRYLGAEFEFVRAGHGRAALDALSIATFQAIFLDMRFDRVQLADLLGDQSALATRLGGDLVRVRQFLEENQGTYILAALREANHRLPVVFSYDFDGEPRRWRRIETRFSPVSYLADTASPDQIREQLEAASAQGPAAG